MQAGNSPYSTNNMGFSWGFTSTSNTHNNKSSDSRKPEADGTISTSFDLGFNSGGSISSALTTGGRSRQKRRYTMENAGNSNNSSNSSSSSGTPANDHPASPRKFMVCKKRVHNSSIVFPSSSSSTTTTTTNRNNIDTWSPSNNTDTSQLYDFLMVRGQPLPLERSLELANEQQLQDIIQELLLFTPEAAQFISSKLSQLPVTNAGLLETLEKKLDKIRENIPYNKAFFNNLTDKLDDYSFDRLKPFILEFLNCLIDYCLNVIPPRNNNNNGNNNNNLHEALMFVDRCTEMVLLLPRFELPSNNYYHDKCLEQLSLIWCTLIQHIANDDILSINARATLVNWYEKLQTYNEKSNDMLQRPLTLFTTLNLVNLDTVPSMEVSKGNTYGLMGSKVCRF